MENLILTLLKNFENKTEDQRNSIVKLLGKLRNYLPEYRTGAYYQLKTDVKDLPYELIWEILLNLDYKEVLKFRLVGKSFEFVINNDKFWQQKLFVDFPAIKKYENYFLYPEKYKYPKILEFLIKPRSFKERYKILRKEMLPTSKLRYSGDLSTVKPLYLEQAKRGINLEEMLKIPGVSDDKDLVYEIVNQKYTLLEKINNRDVALYIVSKLKTKLKPLYLEQARRGINLKKMLKIPGVGDDKDIVMEALSPYDASIFQYASDRLKNDIGFVLKVVKKYPYVYNFLPFKVKHHYLVGIAVRDPSILKVDRHERRIYPKNLLDINWNPP